MRILLDECIDRRFAQELSDHEVATVGQMGWTGITNGRLLAPAAAQFDAFITVDRNLQFQQNLQQPELISNISEFENIDTLKAFESRRCPASPDSHVTEGASRIETD